MVSIDRHSRVPVFIQVANQVVRAIQQGVLSPGRKIPGARSLAILLKVHRNTITAAYEELDAQGWVEIKANKGTFIVAELPKLIEGIKNGYAYPETTGFSFKTSILLDSTYESTSCDWMLTDGTPDIRLTQINDLSRLYSANMKRKSNRKKMNYYSQEGSRYFKEHLCAYLNQTRGMHISTGNILITRSMEMSLFIISEIVLSESDYVVVSRPGYFAANMAFHKNTKNILTIPVDDEGMDISKLEALCREYPIRLVYTIAQNHYPTTVDLSAARRMALLKLAQKYRFVIVEDDHHYDFHYDGHPLLPLATADREGMVIYVGSFGKSLAPGFRTGFVVAPENLMKEMKKFLGIIDRQGDVLMEQALGEMIEEGVIQRHMKRSIKTYLERRDRMAQQLEKELGDWITFRKPGGGLAFWIVFKKKVNLARLKKKCASRNLFIPNTILYQDHHMTAMRIGFGHLEEAELHTCIHILKQSLAEMEL